ncbi:MAG: LamG domain-containing protein, partial [Bacteroidales bacterium]|nr:LamG domain-containing protein [Candidatus Colicola caccequi]
MKKQFVLGLLVTIISLPAWAGGSSKVDYKTPFETYAKWCSAFELNRVWEFNDKGSATNGSNPNGNTSLKETPDMLSFALMTWNDRQDSSDDYRLDWAKIYLTSDKPGNSTIHVCTIHFYSHSGLYDSGSSFSWIFNNFNEGKVSSIESANGKTVCVQRRGLNSHSWDASIFCYFVTEYNEALRKFVNENMGHIKLRIHCSWYGREWRENDETSGLLPSHIMVPITKPTLNNVYWDVEGDKTVTRYHLDPTDSSYETRLEVKAGASHEIQAYTSTTAGDYALAWKDYSWFKRELLNGHLQLIAQNQKKYPISKKNWDEQCGTLSKTTYMNSDVTAVTIPTMVQPTNFGVEDKGTGVLTLNWSTPNGSYEIEDNCGFVVDRSLDSTFKEGVTTYNVTYGSSPYKQEDAFKERGLGKKPFYYRLYRAKTSPKDMALVEKVTVNTDYRGIQDFSVSAQGSQALVKWTLDDNGIWNDQTMCVRLESNKTSPQTFRLDKNSTTVPLTTCDPTNFRLSVQENGVEVSCRTLNDFVLPDETPSAISNLSISKGFYNDHVSVAWKVPQDSSNFHTFEVLREPLNNQSEQTPLGTVDFKLGVYNYSFQDQTAVPGVYYIYTVRGQSACGDKIRNVAVVSGIGFAQPYGVVAGQVAFEGNQGVPDVQVRAEGESVFKSRSLFFTPLFKSESIESTDSTTWSRTISNPLKDHKSGTFEIWLRSPSNNAQEILYGVQSSTMDIDFCNGDIRCFSLYTTQGNNVLGSTIYFDAPHINTRYTHFAFTYDCRENAIDIDIYVDGVLQKQISKTVSNGEVLKLINSDNLQLGAYNNSTAFKWQGDMNEIRFWDGVRTDAEIAEWANKQLTADKQSDPSL